MIEPATVLSEWQGGRLGQLLIQAEARLLAETFDDVFGLELLQLGTWGRGRELLAHAASDRPMRAWASSSRPLPQVPNCSSSRPSVVEVSASSRASAWISSCSSRPPRHSDNTVAGSIIAWLCPECEPILDQG